MYLAGNGPKMPDGKFVIGKLGSGPGQLSVEQAYEASKFAAISMLSAIKAELGANGTYLPIVISDTLMMYGVDCDRELLAALKASSLVQCLDRTTKYCLYNLLYMLKFKLLAIKI